MLESVYTHVLKGTRQEWDAILDQTHPDIADMRRRHRVVLKKANPKQLVASAPAPVANGSRETSTSTTEQAIHRLQSESLALLYVSVAMPCWFGALLNVPPDEPEKIRWS